MNRERLAAYGLGFVVAMGLVVFPRDGAAKSDALEKGRKLYEELEYEKAIPLLMTAAADSIAPKADVVEAFELLGYSNVAMGREAAALEAFIKLLKIDRSFTLKPRTSPKIRAIFDRAKSLVPDEVVVVAPPSLSHVPISTPRPGEPLRIDVTVADASRRVKSVTLRHRSAGVLFQSLPMRETGVGRFSATVDIAPGKTAVEYYFLARDERGITVAALRDEEVPFRVSTRATTPVVKAEGSVFKRWWFWAAIAGAAGISATVAVFASGGSSSTTDYGNTRLIVK
ncbi:MAG: hypothetical protein HYY84_05000 [Deltaproteobacteria bacterium]|nr:hypothetical protein [Deltaproteobacteria bacterium]